MKIDIKQYYSNLDLISSSPSKYEVSNKNGSLIEHKSMIKRFFYAVSQLFGYHTASKLTHRYISHNDWRGFGLTLDIDSAKRIMAVVKPLKDTLEKKEKLSSKSPLIQEGDAVDLRVRAVFHQLETSISISESSSSQGSKRSVRRGFLAVPSRRNYNRLKSWVKNKERLVQGSKIKRQGNLDSEYQRDCLGRSMLVTPQFGVEEIDRHASDRATQLQEKMRSFCGDDPELMNWVKYFLTGNGIGSFFSGISELMPQDEGERGWKSPDADRIQFTRKKDGVSVKLRSSVREQRYVEDGDGDTGIQKSLSVSFDIKRDASGEYAVQNVHYNLSGWLL